MSVSRRRPAEPAPFRPARPGRAGAVAAGPGEVPDHPASKDNRALGVSHGPRGIGASILWDWAPGPPPPVSPGEATLLSRLLRDTLDELGQENQNPP